jgi:hypothetical protein
MHTFILPKFSSLSWQIPVLPDGNHAQQKATTAPKIVIGVRGPPIRKPAIMTAAPARVATA